MTSEAESSKGRPPIPDGEIIERFGGIRPMASKLGVAVTTVQGWKERSHIPEGRFPQIIAAAAEHGVDIGMAAMAAPEPVKAAPEKQPEPKPATEEKPEERKPKTAPEPEPEPTPTQTEATQPTEGEAAAAPPSPAGGVSWLALIVVILLMGGAILTRPLWESKLYPGVAGGPATIDSARLDEIVASLAAIEEATNALARELDAGDRDLSDRIGALEAGGGETGAAFAEQLSAIEQGVNDLAGNLNRLDAGLSGIESRIARLEASEGQVPESVKAGLDAVNAAIGELGQTAGALKDGLASIGGNIGDLEGRVTALETRPVQTGEKIAAMVLALGQVEAAMNAGKPYRAALDRLEILGRDDPVISGGEAVETLSPWADYGIPRRLTLRRDFAGLAPDIDRALSGAEERSWLDSVWNSVAGLVTIRRIDGSDLTPIGHAEKALEDGDLAAVVAAFEGKGSLGPEGDAWLNRVKARINAEREIEALFGQIILPLAGHVGNDGAAEQ